MRTLALFVILATSTTAHAEPKTVSWFLAHPTAREQVHKLCMNDPGEAKHTPDCLNAATAVEQSYINSIPTRRWQKSAPGSHLRTIAGRSAARDE